MSSETETDGVDSFKLVLVALMTLSAGEAKELASTCQCQKVQV